MNSYKPAKFKFSAPVPAGVVLAGVCVSHQRLMLAAELCAENASYLGQQLSNNPDYAGVDLSTVAYLINRRAQEDQRAQVWG